MKKLTVLLAIIAAVFTTTARAQNYSIDWFTIDGGGGTSTGGVYSLSGTIGQPDAGVMTNGPYTLAGGFWSGVNVVQTPGAPLLSVEKLVGGNVRVFWPLPADGFVLDQTSAMASPPATISWSATPFPYQTNATHISITVTPSAPRFYRLRHP